jgi:hypothetical protein
MLSILKHPIVATCGVALCALGLNSMIYFLVQEQMDPVASQTLTDDYRHFIEVRPIWEFIAVHLTYIAGFLAIPFLLLRRKPSVWLFGISAAAAGLTLLPTFILGPFVIGIIMLIAALGAVLFTWFAVRAQAKGYSQWLRSK